jgi:hypothetical protein
MNKVIAAIILITNFIMHGSNTQIQFPIRIKPQADQNINDQSLQSSEIQIQLSVRIKPQLLETVVTQQPQAQTTQGHHNTYRQLTPEELQRIRVAPERTVRPRPRREIEQIPQLDNGDEVSRYCIFACLPLTAQSVQSFFLPIEPHALAISLASATIIAAGGFILAEGCTLYCNNRHR